MVGTYHLQPVLGALVLNHSLLDKAVGGAPICACLPQGCSSILSAMPGVGTGMWDIFHPLLMSMRLGHCVEGSLPSSRVSAVSFWHSILLCHLW